MALDLASRNVRRFNGELWRTLASTLAIVGVVLALLPAVGDLEQRVGLPLLFALRGERPAPADAVILAINSESADALNLPEKPSQWSRDVHSRAVEYLRQAGAAAISFDIFFEEAKIEDANFAAAVEHANNVILSKKLVAGSQAQQSATPNLSQAAALNATFVLPREPVRVDGYWTFKSDDADLATLPVATLQVFARDLTIPLQQLAIGLEAALGNDLQAFPEERNSSQLTQVAKRLQRAFAAQPALLDRALAQVDSMQDRSPRQKQMLRALLRACAEPTDRFLNFYGPPRKVTTIGYDRVANATGALADPALFKGKAVFIGFLPTKWRDYDAIRDDYHTVYSQADGLRLSGVEIAATAFANLLDGSDIKPLAISHQMALFGLWGAFAATLASLLTMRRAAIWLALVSVLYLLWARHTFSVDFRWLPLLVPLIILSPLAFIAATLFKYRFAKRQREQVIQLARQFVPESVLNRPLDDAAPAGPETQLAYGVCLATDVKNYTQLSESLAPKVLADLMNDYFAMLNGIIEWHGGTIADMRGDALLALWAETESSIYLRRQACRAALALRDAIDGFNRRTDRPKLETRIGLHAGEVAIGTLGARGGHLEFRAVGDIVNTASRVEGLNKTLDTTLLATHEVVEAIDDIYVRPLGRFQLHGKSQALEIVELVANEIPKIPDEKHAEFATASNFFRQGNLNEAHTHFENLAQRWNTDGPTRLYTSLCQHRLSEGIRGDWDPTIVVDQK